MTSHTFYKLLGICTIFSLAIAPAVVQADGYGSSPIPGGYQYTGTSSTNTSSGQSHGSSSIPGGYQYNGTPSANTSSGQSHGSSPIPGGYQYNGTPSINTSSGQSHGSSSIPGGYQYNGTPSVNTSSGQSHGSSSIPGGYQYNGTPSVNTSSGQSHGSSPIPGGYQYNGTPSVRTEPNETYGSSPIPGGYQYNGPTPIQNTRPASNGPTYEPNEECYVPGYGSSTKPGGYVYQDPNCLNVSNPQNPTNTSQPRPSTPTPSNNPNPNSNPPRAASSCNNRPYPKDIDGHWSEIYVRRLYDLCIIEGYDDGSFRPNRVVTRAELVKMALYARGINPEEQCTNNSCEIPFDDLDDWQGQWVKPAWEQGIVDGYSSTQFKPNRLVNRAEATKIVLATYGFEPRNDNESFFSDVNGWSLGWVARAHEFGIVSGVGNGNFDPDRPLTRGEAAKLIAKMMEYWDTKIA